MQRLRSSPVKGPVKNLRNHQALYGSRNQPSRLKYAKKADDYSIIDFCSVENNCLSGSRPFLPNQIAKRLIDSAYYQ